MKKHRNTPVLQKYIEHIHKTNLYKVMNGEQVNCSAKSINQKLTYPDFGLNPTTGKNKHNSPPPPYYRHFHSLSSFFSFLLHSGRVIDHRKTLAFRVRG